MRVICSKPPVINAGKGPSRPQLVRADFVSVVDWADWLGPPGWCSLPADPDRGAIMMKQTAPRRNDSRGYQLVSWLGRLSSRVSNSTRDSGALFSMSRRIPFPFSASSASSCTASRYSRTRRRWPRQLRHDCRFSVANSMDAVDESVHHRPHPESRGAAPTESASPRWFRISKRGDSGAEPFGRSEEDGAHRNFHRWPSPRNADDCHDSCKPDLLRTPSTNAVDVAVSCCHY